MLPSTSQGWQVSATPWQVLQTFLAIPSQVPSPVPIGTCIFIGSLRVPQGGDGYISLANATVNDCGTRAEFERLEAARQVVPQRWQDLLPWETEAQRDGVWCSMP